MSSKTFWMSIQSSKIVKTKGGKIVKNKINSRAFVYIVSSCIFITSLKVDKAGVGGVGGTEVQ